MKGRREDDGKRSVAAHAKHSSGAMTEQRGTRLEETGNERTDRGDFRSPSRSHEAGGGHELDRKSLPGSLPRFEPSPGSDEQNLGAGKSPADFPGDRDGREDVPPRASAGQNERAARLPLT